MIKLRFSIYFKTLFIPRQAIHKFQLQQCKVRSKYTDSFQYRILNYFEIIYKEEQFSISRQVREIKLKNSAANRELETLHCRISNITDDPDKKVDSAIIADFDMQCTEKINSLRYSEILSLLNTFLKVIPVDLVNTVFYNKSIELLTKALREGLLMDFEIIHLLFFISLKKKKNSKRVSDLIPYLPDLEYLSTFEKCIAAQAFYKSSVQLPFVQKRVMERVIEKESRQLIADQVLLVCLCKTLRASSPSDKLNLENLNQAIIESSEPLKFQSSIHLISLYAEILLFEQNAVNRLVNDSIKYIDEDRIDHKLRLKDFDRFLYSISRLGLNLTETQRLLLSEYLNLRAREYNLKGNLGIFINSMLCLLMLQCDIKKVIIQCFFKHTFEPILSEEFHWRVIARFQLLINIIIIEMKLNVPEKFQKQISYQYVVSENLQTIADVAQRLVNKNESNIEKVVVGCITKSLRIPGVTLITYEGKRYHIDVLDHHTCLKNTKIPHGYMNLKLRFLQLLNYQTILIEGQIFKNPVNVQHRIRKQIMNSITGKTAFKIKCKDHS